MYRLPNKKIILLIGAIFLFGIFITIMQPFKVIDPSIEGFDPDSFKISDYKDIESIQHAYKALFPPGTPKSYVDRVLVKAGGARAFKFRNEKINLWGYDWPSFYPEGGSRDLFYFNTTDKLINISIGGNSELYPNKPKFIGRR